MRLDHPPLARIICLLSLFAIGPALQGADRPDTTEFFETHIRPVLVERCYECHSSDADEIGGSLLLDSADSMATGGDSGPAIEPGNVEASMLISAIRYESSEMPPDGKLSDEVIKNFERWIAAGAVDPRKNKSSMKLPAEIDLDSGRQFWAFQPLDNSTPASLPSRTSRSTIDHYLDARLHQAEIEPNQLAPPAVRLRRLCFDLTGLPPDTRLQEAWLADPTPSHWLRIVDSLLASPEFGEHWARHWMDVARYADSNGSDFNATFHEAWRYRQYLIRSFTADRPFDEMIRQQIAGDLLPATTDQQRRDNIVASTFLMLGTKMLSERDKEKLTMDVVDEQIDTVGRAFLGLTLGCARCHDHKFDPVPTEDYYALAGIFKSSLTLNGESQKYVSTWNRVPLPTSQQHRDSVSRHKAAVKSLETEIKQSEQSIKALKKRGEGSERGIIVDDADAEKTGSWKASVYFKDFFGVGYVHDDNTNKGEASIRFTTRLPKAGEYEIRIAHSPGSNRASAVPITIRTADGDIQKRMDQRKIRIAPRWTSIGKFNFSADADAVVTISNRGTSGYVIADAVQFLSTDQKDASAPSQIADSGASSSLNKAEQQLQVLQQQLKQLKSSAPDPLPEAMAPTDRPTDQIADSPLHIRGEVRNLGEVIPRGFLQVFGHGSAANRQPQGSGRLDLADWLTDPDNPLVARVYVNRIWMHLMGEGLVRTVDNFGALGQRPTHPHLLDELATEFVRKGWRSKPLIRRIVTSEAYSRSSDYSADAIAADPENKLLWRAHRRRLPAESIRDAMLQVAGKLDHQPRFEPMKGRGVLVSSNNSNSKASFDDVSQACRSIYLPVVRSYMPPLLTALDVADPDLLTGRRPTTNVPSQALVLINSPDVDAWAKTAAERITRQASSFDHRLSLTYQLCLQRDPSPSDREIAESVFGQSEGSIEQWHQYIAAIFAGTEFRLLD